MSITSPNGEFMACLQSQGKNVFLNTWRPTKNQLSSLPHIVLTSPRDWDQHKIEFPATKYYVQEEIESCNVLQKKMRFSILEEQTTVFEEDTIFDTQQFNERLVASVRIKADQAMIDESKEEQRKRTVAKLISATNKKPDQEDDTEPEAPIDTATINVHNTFLSSERHTNTTSFAEIFRCSVRMSL